MSEKHVFESGFECEFDEDDYTIRWPHGTYIIVTENGTLYLGKHGKIPVKVSFDAVYREFE